MKVLALVDVRAGTDVQHVVAALHDELLGTWQLFASDVLREAYATASPARVVFVLEVESAAGAAEHLGKLPLIAAGLLEVELVELRPFVNWSRLFAGT